MVERTQTRPGLFQRPMFTDWLAFVAVGGVGLFSIMLMLLSSQHPYVGVLPFVALLSILLLWKYPSLSILLLFAISAVIEHVREGVQSFTTNLTLWQNLSSSGLSGVPVSPVELLIIAGIAIWFLRNLFAQTLEIHKSQLLRSYGYYLLAVIAGLLHGILVGGNPTIALWEIRSQFYGPAIFFLALHLLRERRHFEALSWIIILGTGFKGLQGAWLYFINYGGNFSGNSLLDHDEAFLFPAYYIFVLLLFAFGGTRRQKLVGVLLLPAVMIADFANNRRASTALLLIGIVALVFILFAVIKSKRLAILRAALAGIIVASLYAGVFWNSESTLAQPLQAFKSQITPTERDTQSDRYREQEDQNLMFAVSQNVIVGQGYGVPMENVAGMVNLEDIAVFIMYMPHNTILWVWWRLGLGGAVLFWLAYGLAIIRNCFLARATTDPYLRRWAVFAVVLLTMSLLIAWWDMGLFRYRVTVYVWTLLAVPEVLGHAITRSHTTETGTASGASA